MKFWLSNFESDTAINKLESVALNSVFLQLDAFTWQKSCHANHLLMYIRVQEDNPTHLLSVVQPDQQYYWTQYKTTSIPMPCPTLPKLHRWTAKEGWIIELSQDNKSIQCILCMTTMQDMVCIFVAHCPVAGNCVTWPTAREWRWLWLTDAMSSVVLKKLLLCQEW